MASAAGYSGRLSECSHKGKLNLPDEPDPALAVVGKVKALAAMIRDSPHTVLHSGAGLSTSAGIADFRGPTGVWTVEAQKSRGKGGGGRGGDGGGDGRGPQPKKSSVSFERATPTLAHMAIAALLSAGHVQYIVSQNVDGLHLRSGVPRDALSELHGNLFVECCPSCDNKEYLRDYQTTSVGFQPIAGHECACGSTLTDKALDWEDNLPERDLERAQEHSQRAALAIVVGSSCQMTPARNLPFRTRVKGAKAAIVNLSKTKLDDRFAMRVRAPCDTVFALLLAELDLPLPRYERTTRVRFSVAQRAHGVVFCRLQSAANTSEADPIGVLESVTFSVAADADADADAALAVEASAPSATRRAAPYACALSGAGCADVTVTAALRFHGGRAYTLTCAAGGAEERALVSAARDYSADAAGLVRAARAARKRPRPAEASAAAGDVDVWFARAERRGYVRCVACARDVASAKKGEHVGGCKGIGAGR